MNTHETNLSSPPPSENLDRMLTEFFHGSMPKPWPSAPVAEIEPSARREDAVFGKASEPQTTTASRSRLTLAASLAGLFMLGAALSYSSSRPNPSDGQAAKPGVLKPSTAEGGTLFVKPTLNNNRHKSIR